MHGKTKVRKGKVKISHCGGKGQDRGKGRERGGGGGPEGETLEMVENRAQCRD